MEPFENNELEHEAETPQAASEEIPQSEPEEIAPPQPQEESQPSAYHGGGAGRKESPYANSPYVVNQQPRQEYHYQPQAEPPQKPAKERKPHKPIWKGIVACLLVAALVATGCLITAASVNEYWEDRTEDTVEMLTEKIDALQKQIDGSAGSKGTLTQIPTDGSAMAPSQLYASCVDSVVAISSTIQASNIYGSTTEGSSSGSGFILTEDGYVITNYHVVEDATAIDVITHDGTEYPAELVGYDSTNDVAVLKVEATGLPAATLGSSNDLVIGDMVVAIGNPLGELTSTQTVGYVSGINREVATDSITTISMIQTDAAINPGNSGGPLFNMYGQVIGITTAKYSGTTGSGASIEGIGFAIPIDDVVPLVEELIDHGYVSSAYLGVTVSNVDAESASMFGLTTSGAYIVSVDKDGAAGRAGIQAKDIITALGEYDVGNVTDLTRALRNFKAGDTTTVTLIRSGKEITLDITLDEKPQETTPVATEPAATAPSSGRSFEEELYDYFRRYFGE